MRISSPIKFALQASFCILILLSACKTGPINVFKQVSPHETYGRKLTSAGLAETEMGRSWLSVSRTVLDKPVQIELPYRERGFFPPEKIQAAAFSFKLLKGQKLSVKLDRTPMNGSPVFVDVWLWQDEGKLDLLGSADTSGIPFESDIRETGTYLLRIQPQLLSATGYTLEVNTGPSLEYPLQTYQPKQIQSFWGAGRDGNSRKHEGIDIFSAFRTPVLAVDEGTARVMNNNLGGKVVFLRSAERGFSVYYAHLDEQYVSDGQRVKIGDTIGFMGNTGNARTTPPHLHLGIYAQGGAVDPLPFVNPVIKPLPKVRADTNRLSNFMRTNDIIRISGVQGESQERLPSGTLVAVSAATSSNYRVDLPDGTSTIVAEGKLSSVSKPIRTGIASGLLYYRPDTLSAVMAELDPSEQVRVLGRFQDFEYIENDLKLQGWIKK